MILAYLLKKISIDDALEIIDILIKLADKEIISVISFNETDFSNTLKLAYNKGITLYDVSYIATAKVDCKVISLSLIKYS